MELEIRNLWKSFGEKRVLKGVTFTAKAGEAFGLLGRNGAGKTTTMRILMHVFAADTGAVLIDGRPLDYKKIRFGYLPEERGLYPKKKVIDQLSYLAELKGMRHKDAVKAVDAWLERLGMTQYRGKRLETLSKGNQQKIQLITALAHDPDIIVLDEPFSGLDPVNAMMLKEVVREEIAGGKIVLFSSHQMSYIEEFCDSIAILNQGEVALGGNLKEIKRSGGRDTLAVRTEVPELLKASYGDRCREMQDGTLLIRLQDPKDKDREMQTIIQTCDVDEIKVYEPSLNDIFVQYTGQ